jgi:hypothetical protein
MDLKEIVSIAGIGGLKKIVKQRPDGLIVSELDGSGKKFMSNRIHMFTPLENISIYTNTDSVELSKVLWSMKTKSAELPPVSTKADVDELREYMGKVLPDYDRDQVFVSDIKKLIKWYHILDDLQLITDPETTEDGDTAPQDEAGSEEHGEDQAAAESSNQ